MTPIFQGLVPALCWQWGLSALWPNLILVSWTVWWMPSPCRRPGALQKLLRPGKNARPAEQAFRISV